MAASLQRHELSTFAMIVGVGAVVALVYADTFASLAAGWSYQDYSHGMLVFPISAYLLWRIRAPLATVDLKPWPLGIAVMAALVLVWLVSTAVSVQAGEHLTAVLLIPAAIATCLGLPVVRCALFPLLFLAAAVPMGDALIPRLMEITADVSAWLLRAAGVPVFRAGQFLSLPGGDFEVAEVCSGLRSLVAGTTISLVFAYLNFRSNTRRALFVAVAAASLIAVNALRAFIVMYVASATDLRWLSGKDHIYFGWVLFGILIGVLFWCGTRFSDARDDDSAAHRTAPTSRAGNATPLALILGLVMLAITAQPFRRDIGNVWWVLPVGALLLWTVSRLVSTPATQASGREAAQDQRRMNAASAIVLALALAVLIGGPVALSRAADASGVESALVLPPARGCGAAEPWSGGWRPRWESPDFDVVGSYRCAGEVVNVSVAGYRSSSQGRELVGEGNRPFPPDWRQFISEDAARFTTARGDTVVNELRVDGGSQRSLIWYWYVLGERTAADPVAVKVSQVLELLTGGRTGGSVFWLETPLAPSVETARARLAAIASEIAPQLSNHSASGLR